MTLLLYAALYAAAFALVWALSRIPMGDGLHFIVTLVAGIGCLFGPIVVYSWISLNHTKRTVEAVGRQWCAENDTEFLNSEIWKNHFVVVYRQGGQKHRK